MSDNDDHAAAMDFLYGADEMEEIEVIALDEDAEDASATTTTIISEEVGGTNEDEEDLTDKESTTDEQAAENKELLTGNAGDFGETSLGEDWENYCWLEPDTRKASESGRLSVYGGTDLPLCTSVNKLGSLGIGVQLYFKLLQHLAVTMFLLTLCSAPVTATFVYGNRFRFRPYFIDSMYFVFTMMANVGDAKSTAQSCVSDTLDSAGECEQSLRSETVTLGGRYENFPMERFSIFAAVCDAGCIIIFVLSVLWFRRSMSLMASKEDQNRTTITDYTIMVKGFPRNATKRDIVNFFSDRFNPNDDFGRVYDKPNERIVDSDLHGDASKQGEEEDKEEEVKKKLDMQRRMSRNDAIAKGIYAFDAEEHEKIKSTKTAEFYKKFKTQDDEHRKRALAVSRMNKMDGINLKRDFFPVKNTANTPESELYKGSWIAEVTMAYEDGPSIRRYMTKQTLVREIKRNKALVQMYSRGSPYEDLDPDGSMKIQCRKRVNDLEETLGRLANTKAEAMIGQPEYPQGYEKNANDGPERRAVLAFVVFNHETSFLRAVEAYGTSHSSWFRACQATRLRFPIPVPNNPDGTPGKSAGAVPIHVSRAPDPSDLEWEYLDTTTKSRRIRLLITTMITLSVLAISSGTSLIVYGTIGEVSNLLGNTGDVCNSIKANVVRHSQQYVLANLTSSSTNSTLFQNATVFPYTYGELDTEIRSIRTKNVACPADWLSLEYVYSATGEPVLDSHHGNITMDASSSRCEVSICPAETCRCVPSERAQLDENSKYLCDPLACTKSRTLVFADGELQLNGTLLAAQEDSTNQATCSKYGPEARRTCYCVETMNLIFEQLGTSLGMAKFLAQDGDMCTGTALLHFGVRQLSFAAVFLVVGINIVLQKLVAFLAAWERHPTKTAFLSAQMMKTFAVLFINTGFVVLIVNSTFGKVKITSDEASSTSDGSNSGDDSNGGASDTGFSSFSTLWYSQVGVSLTLTMVLDVFTPHLPKLSQALIKKPIRKACIRNRRKCKGMRQHSATQQDVNSVFDGIEFVLPVRLATVMNTLAITIIYSGGLPALIPLACMSFTISFNIDRWMMLRHYKRPPEYTTTLVLNYFYIVPFIVLIHLGFSAWMYSDPTVMWSENLADSEYRDLGGFYTFSVEMAQGSLKAIDTRFFFGVASNFLDTMANRITRLAAIPQILTFVFIFGMYFTKFVLITTGLGAIVNIRVCFGQLGWCNRFCQNVICHVCCDRGDAGFEENPPFTEHYAKHCRDTSGRLIKSLELAEKHYITDAEKTQGFLVECDEVRKICFKSKLWGTGGVAFGLRHEGRTPMFTYEMLLYFQGSAYTYSIDQVTSYAKVMEAQKQSRAALVVRVRRLTLAKEEKKRLKELQAAERKEKKEKRKLERAESSRQRKLERGQFSRRSWFGGRNTSSASTTDMVSDVKEELSKKNILTWTAPPESRNVRATRLWKLRNSVKIAEGGMRSVAEMAVKNSTVMSNDKDKVKTPMARLQSFLTEMNMSEYFDKLVADGVEKKQDLVHVTVEDLMELGLRKIKARKVAAVFSKIKKEDEEIEKKKEEEEKEEEGEKDDVELMDFTDFELKEVEDGEDEDDDELIDIGSSSDEEDDSLPRWAKIYDSSSVAFYYHNNEDGSTTWEMPEDYSSPRRDASYSIMSILGKDVKAALLVQKMYRCKQARKVTNQLRKSTTKESEYSIGDWAVVKDSTGHEYYVNQHTGEASWELPSVTEWDSKHTAPKYQSASAALTKALNDFNTNAQNHHVASFDGSWELSLDDVAIHRKSSKYAVESHTESYNTEPKRRNSVMRPDGTWIDNAAPSPAHAAPKRRKSVMRPDGTWVEISMPS